VVNEIGEIIAGLPQQALLRGVLWYNASSGWRCKMKLTAKEARDRFGEVMSVAQHETVTITKYGRPEAAVISARQLAKFEQAMEIAEDAYWLEQAEKGRASGFLSVEESEVFLNEMLNTPDEG